MNTEIGTITNWNDDKGFGFILPSTGGKKVFFHISDYSNKHIRPANGIEVEYLLSLDEKGREGAVGVCPIKGHKKKTLKSKQRKMAISVFTLFSVILAILYLTNSIPLMVVILYATLNVISFFLFAKDKRDALKGNWRTPESTLHLVSLLGGWPAAMLAQSFLRHKSKKVSFRIFLWLSAILNCSALVWLVSSEGSKWLNTTMEKLG